MVTPVSASSTSSACERGFLGLVPWYSGLEMNTSNCELKEPSDIPTFVTKIVLNILVDISLVIGYIAVAMVAWGGYLYMFSRGEPGRAESGKKTLISAAIGLTIALLASVIMRFFSVVLLG